MAVDIVSVILRALGFIALFQAAGIVLFLGLLGEAIDSSYPDTERRIRHVAYRSALIGIVLLLLYQLLGGARMTGEFSGLLDGDMQLRALRVSSGVAVMVRTAGLLLVAATVRGTRGRSRSAAMVGATLVVMSFVITGHTATHAQRWLLAPLLLLHLWVVAFWFGSLWPLRIAVRFDTSRAASLIARFSSLAIRLVPCIAVAGVIMALWLLPGVEALWLPYGLLLLAKASGFALLMVLAALNKWRLGPALRSGDEAAAVRFQRSVLAEYALICLVLIATAVMTGWFSPEA